MRATIHTFINALSTPELSFATLRGFDVKREPNGLPAVHRTSHYAEVEIRLQGVDYLLFMPLSQEVEQMRSRPFLHHERPFVAPLRLLREELCWVDDTGHEQRCDLLLEELPGRPFEVGIELLDTDTLQQAIRQLELDFHQTHFAHNNLKREQLRLLDDRLLVLRPFDASYTSGPSAADHRFLQTLCLEVESYSEQMQGVLSDCEADYYTPIRLPGHLWVGNEFEGLYCVEDPTGFGYVDSMNRFVIPAQFIQAGDFHENRAIVETETGVGVIDCTGAYILRPHFEAIDYLASESLFHALSNGEWHTFDYRGRPITSTDEINIDTIHETIWKL